MEIIFKGCFLTQNIFCMANNILFVYFIAKQLYIFDSKKCILEYITIRK